jgi:hypothetical protein
MRKSWGNPVGVVGKFSRKTVGYYPRVVKLVVLPVGNATTFYTVNQWLLPLLSHSQKLVFQSVSVPVFHTIHSTYNKPQLIKLNYCI